MSGMMREFFWELGVPLLVILIVVFAIIAICIVIAALFWGAIAFAVLSVFKYFGIISLAAVL